MSLLGNGGTTKLFIQKSATIEATYGIVDGTSAGYSFDEYTLPICTRNGRTEDFEKEFKTWTDLNYKIQRRTLGFRLKAEYNWENINAISGTSLDDLLEIANSEKKMFLLFNNIPRKYEVIVDEFKTGLAGGLQSHNSVFISFKGVNLVRYYPNPDLFFMFKAVVGSGTIFMGLEGQNIGEGTIFIP